MAGPRSNTTEYFIGGLNLLFLLLFIPLTRGVLYLAPPPADENPPPQFKLTFDVEYYDRHGAWDDRRWEEAYGRLIESLRTRLGSGSRWARLGAAVLHPQPPEGEDPTLWFHLVLRDQDGATITLRMRGDNLYVVGFRREGGDHTDHDQWWECNNNKQLIKGSKPLGFSCNYNHIVGAAGLQAITDAGLGRHALRDAAAQLATVHLPGSDSRSTARSLLAVIIMVSEATRFREIAHLFMVRVGYGDRQYLTPRMDVLVRGWGDISERIFRADQNPEHGMTDTFPLTLRRGGAEVVLSTAHAAELLLGILLLPRNCPWLPGPHITLAPAQLEGGGATLHYCAEGRPLLEVISVIINDIDGEDPGQLYGTIRVTDALGPQSIYDRDRYNYENVSPEKAATLTGPADRAISALATITIDLDLFDRDFDIFSIPDDQVSRGTIEWDHLTFAKRFDTPLSQNVTGTFGSATVHYVVFSDAVEAKFEVILLRGNDGQQDEVYGRIVARIGDLGIESVLLSTTSSDYSQVWYGDRIPLQRTTVAVPLSSYVRVSALLYDYDSSSAADEIAGGCTYFGAKSSGTTKWRITGQSGEIEVKVTWNPSY